MAVMPIIGDFALGAILSGKATQLVFLVLTLRMLDLFPQARGSAA